MKNVKNAKKGVNIFYDFTNNIFIFASTPADCSGWEERTEDKDSDKYYC